MERIILAAPRGFCAGVAYAIEVVDLALRIHGAPIYVRHAIVHNEWVVRSFEQRGVVFVEDIDDVPRGSVVVFSAHGVSPDVRAHSKERGLTIIDATCPLVTKVHNEAKHYSAKGYYMVYIGHLGHVEAEGTMGEAPGRMTLVETPEDAERLVLPPHEKLSVLTQTTLSVDEVSATMDVLQRRFPHLERPQKEDICYATTNRQMAIRELAAQCDLVLVVGSPSSSNSNRLREVAEGIGPEAHLLLRPDQIRPEWKTDFRTIGISSGASTPEQLVEEVIGELLKGRPDVPVTVLETIKEDVTFKPSRDLIQLAMSR
ncbi:4-hydroxy-3-methylbut-2-enyl diphosphate reductase [Fimbriimonas ginsengisoli]|uniref:4-hydroxy-3-methylbut-2-enyl diphosphate reductase n=1 Tax=Fimbriimonas ginsengisoli Gsoil 348 TaxID=661478 RepID=A0A068NUY4_FIMGI|nr:4-hydroxy-3-methylbut-2-enyl diphosphate reductase [Fimbriimonas ginsengisoli]AIE87358.1 4-hydroxy-3-methylbut-2-enyl diphosphate reductase [Fimbriimonas ginsengisoli Gsoil 348]